jgi:hypothetical protein
MMIPPRLPPRTVPLCIHRRQRPPGPGPVTPPARGRGGPGACPAARGRPKAAAARSRPAATPAQGDGRERPRRHADRAGHRPHRQHGRAPRAQRPAAGSFDLIRQAAGGSAPGGSGTPCTLTISAIDLTSVTQGWPALTLHQSFDAASGRKPGGTGQGYQCTQALPVPVPGSPPAARWPATRCNAWPP